MVKTPTKLTFEQYLEYDDGTNNSYELLDGELVEVPPESEVNLFLAQWLGRQFEKFVGLRRVKLQGLELAVPTLPGMPLNRKPDLTVVRSEHIQQMGKLGKAAITLDMLPPLLVAEVVSPYKHQNDDNYQRDYVDKVQQYQARGIPEYWIIDPQAKLITILILKNGSYEQQKFQGEKQIISPTFPNLKLTVAQVISAN